jgi:pimeloyl-ACP methyl ester carboxylesterase
MTATTFRLRGLNSFFVGAESVHLDLPPTGNVALAMGSAARPLQQAGDYETGQMYVQGFLGADDDTSLPLMMWHGGGMTGVTWETTPDGRPGWLELALRDGFDVYVSDAMERGRAAPPPDAVNGMDVVFRPKELSWDVFRMGPVGGYATDPAARQIFPGQRFPMAAYDTLARQFVPRWPALVDRVKRAYRAYLERFPECIVMAHSQGGGMAIETTLAVPGHAKALVLVEPSGAPDFDDVGANADIPHLVVWGDFFAQSPRWQEYRAEVERYLDAVTAAGGRVNVIDLPAMGIMGNSHCPMMDDNSAEIWRMVSDWLGERF